MKAKVMPQIRYVSEWDDITRDYAAQQIRQHRREHMAWRILPGIYQLHEDDYGNTVTIRTTGVAF